MADNEKQESRDSTDSKAVRSARPRLRKALPTDRATFSKQLDVLRAAAAASGPDRKPISNDEVAKVVNIHFGTVSNCNPFFLESGLITRHKNQNVPCDEVFTYADRYKWEPDKAAQRLAPVIRKTWFCSTLVPKLTYRPLSIDEAISFLADEAGASPEYKAQLFMLIEYLRVSGIVTVDSGIVSLVRESVESGGSTPEIPSGAAPKVNSVTPELSKVTSTHHPFIEGLLKTLPESETEWTLAGRVKWLQAASNIFGLIYTDTSSAENEYIEIAKKKL